jgi:hypothetical protein
MKPDISMTIGKHQRAAISAAGGRNLEGMGHRISR